MILNEVEGVVLEERSDHKQFPIEPGVDRSRIPVRLRGRLETVRMAANLRVRRARVDLPFNL
jgi:hypothetical protein